MLLQTISKCKSFKEVLFLSCRVACCGCCCVCLCWQMLAQKSGNIINMSSVASSIKGRSFFPWESHRLPYLHELWVFATSIAEIIKLTYNFKTTFLKIGIKFLLSFLPSLSTSRKKYFHLPFLVFLLMDMEMKNQARRRKYLSI